MAYSESVHTGLEQIINRGLSTNIMQFADVGAVGSFLEIGYGNIDELINLVNVLRIIYGTNTDDIAKLVYYIETTIRSGKIDGENIKDFLNLVCCAYLNSSFRSLTGVASNMVNLDYDQTYASKGTVNKHGIMFFLERLQRKLCNAQDGNSVISAVAASEATDLHASFSSHGAHDKFVTSLRPIRPQDYVRFLIQSFSFLRVDQTQLRKLGRKIFLGYCDMGCTGYGPEGIIWSASTMINTGYPDIAYGFISNALHVSAIHHDRLARSSLGGAFQGDYDNDDFMGLPRNKRRSIVKLGIDEMREVFPTGTDTTLYTASARIAHNGYIVPVPDRTLLLTNLMSNTRQNEVNEETFRFRTAFIMRACRRPNVLVCGFQPRPGELIGGLTAQEYYLHHLREVITNVYFGTDKLTGPLTSSTKINKIPNIGATVCYRRVPGEEHELSNTSIQSLLERTTELGYSSNLSKIRLGPVNHISSSRCISMLETLDRLYNFLYYAKKAHIHKPQEFRRLWLSRGFKGTFDTIPTSERDIYPLIERLRVSLKSMIVPNAWLYHGLD